MLGLVQLLARGDYVILVLRLAGFFLFVFGLEWSLKWLWTKLMRH